MHHFESENLLTGGFPWDPQFVHTRVGVSGIWYLTSSLSLSSSRALEDEKLRKNNKLATGSFFVFRLFEREHQRQSCLEEKSIPPQKEPTYQPSVLENRLEFCYLFKRTKIEYFSSSKQITSNHSPERRYEF